MTLKKRLAGLLLALTLVGASGCATDPSRDETVQGSSGPTVYGQLNVSIDHVSVSGR
jgi:hypothetical protein